jgi:hypothetical protein
MKCIVHGLILFLTLPGSLFPQDVLQPPFSYIDNRIILKVLDTAGNNQNFLFDTGPGDMVIDSSRNGRIYNIRKYHTTNMPVALDGVFGVNFMVMEYIVVLYFIDSLFIMK